MWFLNLNIQLNQKFMNRKEQPQISETTLKPLLSFKKIKKGTKIHRKNNQSEVHWQLTSYIITGIDNEHQVLLVKDMEDKPQALPFHSLEAYFVSVHHDHKVDTKRYLPKKTPKTQTA